jgi:hypothetical protein
VTLSVTAPLGTPHGTYSVAVNGGAAATNFYIDDSYESLSGSVTVTAGDNERVQGPRLSCTEENPTFNIENCGSPLIFATGPQGRVSWVSGGVVNDSVVVFLEPPLETQPGDNYTGTIDYGPWCTSYSDFDCEYEFGIEVDAPAPAPALTCTSMVTRGSVATCTVTGGTVSQWSFSGQGFTLTGPTGGATWSGLMVISGTVTANVGGQNLTAGIVVTARPSFPMITAPPAQQVANGSKVGSIQLPTLTSPPTTDEGSMAQSAYGFSFSVQPSSPVQNGPNTGLLYAMGFTDRSVFGWEMNPALTNADDPFYKAQGGCFATVQQIINVVQNHEAGPLPAQSHYSELQAFLAVPANNPATVAEGAWGNTTADLTTLINAAYQAAVNSAAPEPPGDLSSLRINYPPYQQCGQ